jgi:hypothetical protein
MLAYCHWLVANKVFRSITMSFLPVGHTHKDVAQMFSGFVSGMHKQPHVNTVEDFISGLCTWYTVPQLQPIPIFLYEVWSIKSWLEPYLRAVKGTSKPGIFKFELSDDGSVHMSTKDYASTTSGWHEPIKFLSIVPMDSPANLPPATLDEAVLKDTLVALTKMYNHLPLQQSFISLIRKFNLPEQDNLIPDPFEWVYTYHHSPDQYIPHPHNGPFNAQMTMSGRATFELIQTLPDIGAIAAFAGENGEYWLGKVMRTTRTRIFVHWLDQKDGIWSLTTLPHSSVKMTTLLNADVSLGIDCSLRPTMHNRLVSTRANWDISDIEESDFQSSGI